MRLYSMNKREFVMVFIILLTAMGLVLFIGLTGISIGISIQSQIIIGTFWFIHFSEDS